MDLASNKIIKSVNGAPIGAAIGAITGYLVAKQLGYDKTLTVISFTTVGTLIGAAIGAEIK